MKDFLPTALNRRRNRGFFGDDEFSNIIDNFWDTFDSSFGSNFYRDENNNVVVEIEAPGFNKDNINVEISNGTLIVNGERKLGNEKSAGKTKIFKQYSIGSLTDAECKIKDGIVYVTIKMPEDEKPKKIEVAED